MISKPRGYKNKQTPAYALDPKGGLVPLNRAAFRAELSRLGLNDKDTRKGFGHNYYNLKQRQANENQ